MASELSRGIHRLRATIVMALALLPMLAVGVALAQDPAGAPSEPATVTGQPGPGQPAAPRAGRPYVNPLWFCLVVVTVGFWLYLTSWVSQDARGAGLDFPKAAMALLGCGVLGLLLTLVLHAAFAFLMLALILGAFSLYIILRNRVVPERFQFLGPYHRIQLLSKIPLLNRLAVVGEGFRAEVPVLGLTNKAGMSLDDVVSDQPVLSRAAAVLVEIVERAGVTRTRKVRLQPAEDQYVVQFILDGVVHNVDSLNGELAHNILVCASELAGLSGGGRMRRGAAQLYTDLPGQGRVPIGFEFQSLNRQPMLVLNMPDWTREVYLAGLEGLGMHESIAKRVRAALDQKKGALLVCAPPGCGKVTTLYAIINTLDVFTTSVAALDEPDAPEIEHVRRWALGAGRPFAELYHEIVREGPDVVLMREISTSEHTRHLLRFAAEEGLMIAGIKATDSPQALLRVSKLAGDPDLVDQSVVCVLSQRMPRKLCINCRKPVEPDPETLAKLKIGAEHAGPWYGPVGCEACLNTGYRGRTGIFGMLILTDPVKAALRQEDVTPETVRKAAGEAAFRTMYQDGVGKVVAGITTLSEIRRVLQRRRTGEEKK